MTRYIFFQSVQRRLGPIDLQRVTSLQKGAVCTTAIKAVQRSLIIYLLFQTPRSIGFRRRG